MSATAQGVVGVAMVLGKLPVPGRPTVCFILGQGPTALTVGAGGGLFRHFFCRLSFLFSYSLSLCETVRYRLKYCYQSSPKNKDKPQRVQSWKPAISDRQPEDLLACFGFNGPLMVGWLFWV